MKKNEISPEFWDKRAHKYGINASGYGNPFAEKYREKIWYDKISKNLDIHKETKILDCGCGGGKFSVKLAKKGANVTGIDISKELLKHANTNAKHNHVNIDFLNIKIKEIEFKNEFDAVICMGVLQHIVEENKFNLAVEKLIKSTKKGKYIITIESVNQLTEENIALTEDNTNFMKIRSIKSYINSFENKGAQLVDYEGVSIFELHIVHTEKLKINILKEIIFNIAIKIDKTLTSQKIFSKYFNPTIFIFQKI